MLLFPVVLKLPAPIPINVFPVAVFALISIRAVPSEDLRLTNGVDTAVIDLIEITIVPLKSVVGVMVSEAVDVVVGHQAHVAVNPEALCPPNPIVNEPAVLPVTV